jgi:predicted DNA-binding protein YlxM (UPF0122 family)
MNGLLEQAMSKLSPRKRQVLDLYYFKGLTMKETGTRMGVCESRVSQIHSSAVASLKARMKEVLIAKQRDETLKKQAWIKPVPGLSQRLHETESKRNQQEPVLPLSGAPVRAPRPRRSRIQGKKPGGALHVSSKDARQKA